MNDEIHGDEPEIEQDRRQLREELYELQLLEADFKHEFFDKEDIDICNIIQVKN